MKKLLKKLTFQYYLVYVAATLTAVIGFQLNRSGVFIDPASSLGIALNSILIIFLIGSIPITLAIFNKKAKQWALLEDVQERFMRYRKGSEIRLLIIGLGFILGVLFFFLTNSQSMIFCAGISAIALFFCKPAEVKIISELQIEDPDQYL